MRQDTLTEEDAELFYRLKHSLYLYANRTINMWSDSNDWKSVYTHELEEIRKVRDYVFKNMKIIDEFVQKNPFHLSQEELDIILSWKQAISATRAIIGKYKKEHTLILHKNAVYGIKGITDSLEDLFGGYTPVFVNITLLPFKEMLTHEGLFTSAPVVFGRTMKNSILAEVEEIALKNGVITSLTQNPVKNTLPETELLRFYMKSEVNRDKFYDAIEKLMEKSPELLAIHNYEWGRIHAKNIKAELAKQGIKGYFAVLMNTVVASSTEKKKLEEAIKKIVPSEKQNQVYTFEL